MKAFPETAFILLLGLGTSCGSESSEISEVVAPQLQEVEASTQDPAARFEQLSEEANQANLEWAQGLLELQAAEKAGGDSIPTSAWISPLVDFVPRFQSAARDYQGEDAAIPYLKWITKEAMPMEGAGREAAEAALRELVTTHRKSESLEELSWMLGRLVYFFGEEDGAAIGAALEADSPSEVVRTWAVFSRNSGTLEAAPVDSDEYKSAIRELRSALAKVEIPILEEEVENRIAVKAKFSLGMVAPDIQGVDLSGTPFALSDYKGKVILVDFWGDW